MPGITEITSGLYWIGSEDPDRRTFDDLFPTERGTTYNSYLKLLPAACPGPSR